MIRTQLEMDEQAPFLGEIALVSGDSPVKQSGLVFRNTLFDENATCHIAFGNGFPFLLRTPRPTTRSSEASTCRQCTPTSWSGAPTSTSTDSTPRVAATPIIHDDVWVL